MRIAVHLLLLAAVALAACANAAPPRLYGPPITPRDVIDYSCHADADCAVKDVGNCCGAMPACVNRDSPTFPERVHAECARNHTAGVCGFPVVQGCRCVDSRCQDVTGGEGSDR